jgi:hypothetical protein
VAERSGVRRRMGAAVAIAADFVIFGFGVRLLLDREWIAGTAFTLLGIALAAGEGLSLLVRRGRAESATLAYALAFFPMIGVWLITFAALDLSWFSVIGIVLGLACVAVGVRLALRLRRRPDAR